MRAPPRDCKSCGRVYLPHSSEHVFCSETCRLQFHTGRATVFKEKHTVTVARLLHDQEELIQEISGLRKEILRLDKLIEKLKE